MKEFEEIYVTWRQGQGCRRFVIGRLSQSPTGSFSFSYLIENVEKAKKDGFSPYTEFPQLDRTYNGNVLDIFSQRLIRIERTDVQSFYDFWEIEPEYRSDKYYLLAHTQGLSPTDNFEFLADYNAIDGLHFVSELANISDKKLPIGSLKAGEFLQYKLEPNNEHDQHAVKVLKDGKAVGYIKKIHSKVFYKPGGEKLRVQIKALDQNGFIKRAFVKIFKV